MSFAIHHNTLLHELSAATPHHNCVTYAKNAKNFRPAEGGFCLALEETHSMMHFMFPAFPID